MAAGMCSSMATASSRSGGELMRHISLVAHTPMCTLLACNFKMVHV